ncbi:MAG: hypothetical protein ACOCXT_00120 [Candidatus Dojkabacteria bacterium]
MNTKNNKPLLLLLIAGNIWYFGEGMFGPLLAVFAERIGGDLLDITWVWATLIAKHALCSTLGYQLPPLFPATNPELHAQERL